MNAGCTCISDDRRAFHVATEAASVLLVAPFAVWLATRPGLPRWARAGAVALALGIVVVDGGLLATWSQQPRMPRGA